MFSILSLKVAIVSFMLLVAGGNAVITDLNFGLSRPDDSGVVDNDGAVCANDVCSAPLDDVDGSISGLADANATLGNAKSEVAISAERIGGFSGPVDADVTLGNAKFDAAISAEGAP